MADNGGIVNAIKNVYNDPFMWSVVKSWGFFIGGIFVARELLEFDASGGVAAV